MPVRLVGAKRNQSQRRKREQVVVREFSGESVPGYKEILTYVHYVLVAGSPWVTAASRQEAAQHLKDYTGRVALCGSERVISAFLNLGQATHACATAPSLARLGDQFEALKDLLLVIRAELGYENGDSERDGLLPLFVSDLDRYLCQSGIG